MTRIHPDARDPRPDPALGELLRELRADAPSNAELDSLRAHIVARAELPLARRRQPPVRAAAAAQRQRTSSGRPWLAPLIPLATAAGLALTVWAGRGTAPRAPAPAVPQVEEMLAAEGSDEEFLLRVTGHDDPAALLELALE